MDLRDVGRESVDCSDLAQDKDKWRDIVNEVINIGVPPNGWDLTT